MISDFDMILRVQEPPRSLPERSNLVKNVEQVAKKRQGQEGAHARRKRERPKSSDSDLSKPLVLYVMCAHSCPRQHSAASQHSRCFAGAPNDVEMEETAVG